MSLNGTWAATFIIDTSGDFNYCNYAHGKLTISCYTGSSFSVTLLSGPDYNETIYAYIDSSFNCLSGDIDVVTNNNESN